MLSKVFEEVVLTYAFVRVATVMPRLTQTE